MNRSGRVPVKTCIALDLPRGGRSRRRRMACAFLLSSLWWTAPAIAEDFDGLAPGDRIEIKVFDQPDLSGSYLVEPSGEVNFPLLGSLKVSSMTTRGLQTELTNRLGNGYIQNPVVSVHLSELRPITIVGDVRAVGRYAFVSGMTVETALALAGGGLGLTTEEAAQGSDLLRAEERVRSLTLADKAGRVRSARIEAELKDQTTFTVVDSEPHDPELIKRLKDAEQAVLDADRTAMTNQSALLNQQARTTEGLIQSFSEQVDLEKRQIEILDSEIRDLSGLLAKGITRKAPVQDIDRERTKTQSNLVRVLGELAQAKSTSAEVKLKVDDIINAMRNRLTAELQRTTLQLEETGVSLPLMREELRMRRQRLPILAGAHGPQEVRISRYRNDKTETIQATLATPILPGDIIQVGHGSTTDGIPTASTGLPTPVGSVRVEPVVDPPRGEAGTVLRDPGQNRFSRR